MTFSQTLGWMVLAAALIGCGSDDEGSDRGTAPTIDALSYAPRTMTVGQQVNVSGTLSFEDPDGDLRSVAYSVTSPSGQVANAPAGALQGTSGQTMGQLQFAFAMTPPEAGQYLFDIWLTDAAGHDSNRLRGNLTAE
jgi:hypothetical protein